MGVPFRFIHAADLHLDSPYKGFAKAPQHVLEELTASTSAAVRRLTDLAIDSQVDFVVLAGDLFDQASRSLRSQLMLVAEWERLAAHNIGVFAIYGNHDPVEGDQASLSLPRNVHICKADSLSCFPAYRQDGELAAYVYGISYAQRHVYENLSDQYVIDPAGPFHIALLHGTVDAATGHDPYAPCSLTELVAKPFHYWAMGHIHQAQLLHEYPHVVYAGNTQGRHAKEIGPKGCYVVDVSANGEIQQKFEPLDVIRWTEAQLSIEGVQSEQDLLLRADGILDGLMTAAEGCSLMVRLQLIGRGGLHSRLIRREVQSALLDQLQEACVQTDPGDPWLFVHALEVNTAVERDNHLLQENGLAKELQAIVEQLQQDPLAWSAFAAVAIAPLTDHPTLYKNLGDEWENPSKEWLEQASALVLGMMAEQME